MKLYRKGGNYGVSRYSVMVQPGNQHPTVSDFVDKDGKPILFDIVFTYGVAENVPDNLGRYVLDQGLAQETRFILPR